MPHGAVGCWSLWGIDHRSCSVGSSPCKKVLGETSGGGTQPQHIVLKKILHNKLTQKVSGKIHMDPTQYTIVHELWLFGIGMGVSIILASFYLIGFKE